MSSRKQAIAVLGAMCLVGAMFPQSAIGTIIRLDNTGTLGSSLDEIDSADLGLPAAGPHATEIAGLTLTVTGLGADGTGEDVNVTATSLGINAGGGADDTDAFDADLNEFLTLRFNQDVLISQLDFTTFSAGETFNFAGNVITNGDLSNGTLDTFDFVSPFAISANTDFTLSATAGTIGIEAFDVQLQVVPEPSTLALLSLSSAYLMRRRRS